MSRISAIDGRPPDQIGILVPDLEEALERYEGIWGGGPWRIFTYGPGRIPWLTYRGSPGTYSLRLAISAAKPQIELVEPLEGPSIYEEFLEHLRPVWEHCYRVLVPGGRLVIVVGDVCLSRRQHGRHVVVPLHADICVLCRKLGFDNLNPIIWHKIANANYEVSNGTKFLGKPYEPNAIIKNDIEFILMQRKPGGYRQPTAEQRRESKIAKAEYAAWFQQFWNLTGASTKNHPAPFPLELAYRLVRMFSFSGDTVLDPFLGTGTTVVAAMKSGRHSIGVELEKKYLEQARKRILKETDNLFCGADLRFEDQSRKSPAGARR